jgi:hypothetical protein
LWLIGVCLVCLQEAEKTWAKIDAEVAEVALEVAEAVWDGLLQDTAQLLMGLEGVTE